jgi:malate dehydrogenase
MKVAIIGAGDVGATCALRIAEADLADVVLLDIVEAKAKAVALDLNSASSIVRHSCSIIGTNDYQNIAGADIIVIAAGQTRKPNQRRQDLLHTNAQIIKKIAKKITHYCSGSIVIVVTNPVDVLTYLVYKITGFGANQVIGMGGVSDCARFNMLVAEALHTSSHFIQSVIIGPHSDKMVVLPRMSTMQGIPISELLPAKRIKKIVEDTQNFGAKIVQLLGSGSAYYGPSAGIFSLVDAIINDRKSVVCACVYLAGQYGLQDVCIGVPINLGKFGVEQIIELHLTKKENSLLRIAAKEIKDSIKHLGV